QIHPYVSLAWSVLSAANKVIINQHGRDDRIVRLAGIMNDAFAFVLEAEPLKAIKAHLKVITLLVQQATECGYFIAEYAKANSFLTRTMKYTFSDIDARITEYENKLLELKNAFLQGVAVHTSVTVFRIMNQVQDITTAIDLNDMPYAAGARYAEERGCFAGTRKTFISEICDIINNPADDAPQVCLLTGVAGSGKSAIAHTVARLYDQQHRLGSSYCFNTSHAATRHPGNFFSTIARDLSDHDRQYKEYLWEVVKDNCSLRTSTSPVDQVKFIARASEHLDVIGPILVVVDALDESGDRAARESLLSALSNQITESKLPTNLRLLITARPESDILKILSSSQVAHKQLDEVDTTMVDADIGEFVKDSLRDYDELDLRWHDQEWCRLLVHHSQHLFQWASTACNFIKGEGFAGLDPCKQLELLLSTTGGHSPHPLDVLYRTILGQLFNTAALDQFRDVMGVVLALNEPLSLSALEGMFHGKVNFGCIIQSMGSLLAGVANKQKPVQPLHTSFRDFLLDGDCSLAFHVPITSQHQHNIGLASIACMQRMLKFNMCNLEDSRVFNSKVDGLQERVKAAIPPYLAYSCQYWMEHLHSGEYSQDVVDQVTDFFKSCFPYWLEAISLLSQLVPIIHISSAQQSCVLLEKWAKVNSASVASLAAEAVCFIDGFALVLQESTPHLYLSAMPYTPSKSALRSLWTHKLKHGVCFTPDHPQTWPTAVQMLSGHAGRIASVAYSPDGQHIISGSDDKTVRIWNASTGQLVTDPLQGHTASIHSVAYSPDGQHIVSGSFDKTIRIWNARAGQLVTDPLLGHTVSNGSVANSPLALADWCPKDNGWICTASNSIICWLPHWARCISDPRNNTVILPQHITWADFTDFAYGQLWTQCWA
ncbi:hypothetical protein HYDPIDRAFT_101954, partial [Hydnomerulius pinastri MD-312]